MRQNDRVNEVFATWSTRRSTQEEIISATSSSGPHSGNNIFSVAFFRLQANKFIPSSSAAISVGNDISDETVFIEQLNAQQLNNQLVISLYFTIIYFQIVSNHIFFNLQFL